jgi:hypothetical protein
MRTGIFHQTLQAWEGRPVALTVRVSWSEAAPLVIAGLLHPDGSPRSLRGWRIVPPLAASDGVQPLPLRLNTMVARRHTGESTGDATLHFWSNPSIRFELTLLRDMRYAAYATRPTSQRAS